MVVLLHRIVFRMEEGAGELQASARIPWSSPELGNEAIIRMECSGLDCIVRYSVLPELVVARGDDDQIHAGGADLVLDRRLRSAAECNHGENRRHADGHSDHGQCSLQLVSASALQCNNDAIFSYY